MRWKKILLLAVLLIIAMIATFSAILVFYDFNKFKPRIIHAVREATGRELTLDGDIKFLLGLAPTLSIENIRFQNAAWGSRADMVRVKRFEVQVAVIPLIRGEIRINRFILVEPDILLETNTSGDANFRFQSRQTQKTPAHKGPGWVFGKVQIKNGRLRYNDGRSQGRYALEIDRFSAVAPGEKKPLTVYLRGIFNKKSFEIQATLDRLFSAIESGEPMAIELTAKTNGSTVNIKGLVRDPVNVAGLDCSLTAAGSSILNIIDFNGISGVPDIGPYRLTARLSGALDRLTLDAVALYAGNENQLWGMVSGSIANLLNLQGVELDFQFRGKDIGNLDALFGRPVPLKGSFAVSGRLVDPVMTAYRFKDLVVRLGDNTITGSIGIDLSGHQPRWTVALASRRLDLRPVWLAVDSDIQRAESFADLGPMALVVNANGPIAQLSVEKIDFQAGDENLAKISMRGSIEDLTALRGIGLNFSIRGKNTARLEELLNRPIPLQGAFSVSGQIIDPAAKTYRLNSLDVRAGDSDVRGAIDINLTGQTPEINASLISSKLNLRPLRSDPNRDAPAKNAKRPQKLSTGRPFSADLLTVVNGDMTLQTGRLLLPDLTVNRMNVAMALRDGHLRVNARGPSLPDISQLVGLKDLPPLGRYEISAEIRADNAGRLYVENMQFSAGKEQFAHINIQARINDLIAMSDITGRFIVRGENIANLAPLVGRPLPLEGRYSAVGNLTMPSVDFYRLRNLEIVVGPNDISGRADLELDNKRLRLKAFLTSQKLDLRPPPAHTADAKSEAIPYKPVRGGQNKASTKIALPLNLLTTVDASCTLHVAKLIVPDLLINDLNLVVNLQRGYYSITAASRATPDIAELTGVTGLADLGPSKLVLKGVAADDKLRVENLDYQAGSQELFEVRLKGSAKDLLNWRGITSSFRISGNDSAKLAILIKKQVPYTGSFSISGKLMDPAHHIYNFDQIRIVIGDNDLTGWLDLNLTGDRPRVRAELTSRRWDLRWLYPETDPKNRPPTATTLADKKRKKIFPNTPLPLDLLKPADIDINIQGDEVVLPRVTARNLTAGFKLDNGHLKVRPLKFMAGEGSVEGFLNLRLEERGLALETEIEIDQLLLQSAIKDLDVSRTLEGAIDAKIKISTRGDSIAALMAGLNGKITYAHRGGQIANRYFSLFFGDLTSELIRRINVFSRQQKTTEIKCFVSHLAINDGVADQAFVLDTTQSVLSGAGKLDFKTETLDVAFKTSPKKGVKIPGVGKVSLSLGELTRPFKIGGTFTNPTLNMDPARTAVTFGKVIGGLAFGPAGLAVVFGDVSSKKAKPCLDALKAAEESTGSVDALENKKVNKKRWWQK